MSCADQPLQLMSKTAIVSLCDLRISLYALRGAEVGPAICEDAGTSSQIALRVCRETVRLEASSFS